MNFDRPYIHEVIVKLRLCFTLFFLDLFAKGWGHKNSFVAISMMLCKDYATV